MTSAPSKTDNIAPYRMSFQMVLLARATKLQLLRRALRGDIGKLHPERVLCKHVIFLCFTNSIRLKHIYCNCFTLRSMCLNTYEKKTKSPRELYPLFHMSQNGSSPEISVKRYRFQSCPFLGGRHLYPGASHLSIHMIPLSFIVCGSNTIYPPYL